MSEYLPYTLPFLVFVSLSYMVPLLDLSNSIVYPIKTFICLVFLIFFWPKIKQEIHPFMDMNAVLAGITGFILWIGLEGSYQSLGNPAGFNPHEMAQGGWVWGLMAVRMLGAALVVPIMEELFWRSFALRFLMDRAFYKVPLGKFSWFSFIFVSIAFGLEHHRWLPGILTGMLYAIMLYQKKNLFSPILAHGITNLLLGIYVVVNQSWEFW